MKIDLPYVDKREKNGRVYWYFRKRGMPLIALPDVPGMPEFMERYKELLHAHAPKVHAAARRRDGLETGSLAWVIEQFTAPKALPWSELSPGTREKYRLRFDWLRKRSGEVLLAAFDRDMVKTIKEELKNGIAVGNKIKGGPSIANETIDRIGQLWRWADENCVLTGVAKLKTTDPTQGIARVAVETESALVWPEELCQKFERQGHAEMTTFYFLARYTGQRRGDCIDMTWTDFNAERNEISVVQEKTNKKLWVPCHTRLRQHLDGLTQRGDYILMSPRGSKYSRPAVSKNVAAICRSLGFSGYSPHGLRHAAAMTMIEAGCTVDEAMAITGHNSRSQLDGYLKEVRQREMAQQAMRKWEAADDARARTAAALQTADNVTPLRRPA